MKVTVVVPSYKPGEYIKNCLLSLEDTNGFPADDFEILVVLNGCKEPYLSNINEFIAGRGLNNARVIQTDEPGVSNARNTGINNARGEYVCFIDDDDRVSPGYIGELLKLASPGAVSCSNMVNLMPDGTTDNGYFLARAYDSIRSLPRHTLFNSRKFLSSSCAKLIPMAAIGKRRFNSRYKLGEDSLFMFTISNKIKEIHIAPPSAVYYVSVRENSASRKHHSFGERAEVALRLTLSYLAVYLRSPWRYNFLFWASRVYATLRKLTYKKYE